MLFFSYWPCCSLILFKTKQDMIRSREDHAQLNILNYKTMQELEAYQPNATKLRNTWC